MIMMRLSRESKGNPSLFPVRHEKIHQDFAFHTKISTSNYLVFLFWGKKKLIWSSFLSLLIFATTNKDKRALTLTLIDFLCHSKTVKRITGLFVPFCGTKRQFSAFSACTKL